MCIFTGEVDVSKTNIFVAKIGLTEQLTVYSNTVKLKAKVMTDGLWGDGTPQQPRIQVLEKRTAMMLPIPLYGGDASSIRMIDMSSDADFFKRLAKVMEVPTLSMNKCRSSSYLSVHRCGPYSYSVVPDISAFNAIDVDVFGANESLVNALKQRYPVSYAFLVCIIDSDRTFSPIAYVHPLKGRVLFVPTLHEHGNGMKEFADDWDHRIYSLDESTNTSLLDGRKVACVLTSAQETVPVVNPSFVYARLDWSRLKCRRIKGVQPNGDIGIACL